MKMGFFMQVFRELRADLFRTQLSLLGVAAGIFSVVAALTLVDSLQQAVHEGFSAYGNELLSIDREPLEPDLNEDGVFRWWEYAARPPVTWQDYRFLKEYGAADFEGLAYVSYGVRTVGVDGDWRLLVRQPFAAGRGFTTGELARGVPVAVVGADVEASCGDKLWINGVRHEVIGVFEKAGMTSVCPVDIDHVQLIPFRTQQEAVLRGSMLVSGADPEKIRTLMRRARRLRPLEPDDFSLNEMSFLVEEMDAVFALASRMGWVIGFFALLSGGIGIANMLYVSVEERRSQIGICRALGARRRVILQEFLGEAALLSLLGAAAGIGLVAVLATILRRWATELPLALSLRSALAGLGIALLVGLVSGAAPARRASRLSPVQAIAGNKNEG